ncbi:MAG: VWA domain-containing protein [Candidatus Electryonea clarkiae]|nr:VWA domain-containing protein [Candidatus Electryonea clarkiae]MDP8286911.1 VWA domain-containing protein [Candidatus Electryonea clarkiae]
MKKAIRTILIMATVLIAGQNVQGEAILYPEHVDFPTDYIPLKKINAEITITDHIATTIIEQTFEINWDEGEADANYYYPVPALASVTGFGIWEEEGLIYFPLLRGEEREPQGGGAGDPELQDYLGSNPFFAPLPELPGGEVILRLEYSQLMEYEFGQYHYTYPLGMGGFLEQDIDSVEVRINITSQRAINLVTLDNYLAETSYQSQDSVSMVFTGFDMEPEDHMDMTIEVNQEDTGMWLMTQHDILDSSAHFLAVLEPGVQGDDVIQKYFTFVLDVSGSMSGNKIIEAKEAASYCVEHLNPDDYMNIIAFSNGVNSWRDEPVLANQGNVNLALDFIDDLSAGGSTNLNSAMMTALNQEMGEASANQILLVSDGHPNGSLPTILENIENANDQGASIFTVGVGGSNLDFLNMIAYENNGLSISIASAGDNIAGEIETFFTKFSNPALINLALDFGDVEIDELYPPEPYTIFYGSQTVVAGRYSTFGEVEVNITGRIAGEDVELQYGPFDFEEGAEGFPFVPRMWAMSKIDYYLAWMAVHGENDDIIEMIIALSLDYGILTPYTNFGTGDDDDDDDDGTDVENDALNVSIQSNEKGIELTWRVGFEPDGSLYMVYRRNYNGYAYIPLTRDPISAHYFYDNNVVPGERYVYKVVMIMPDGSKTFAELEVKANGASLDFLSIHPNPFNSEARISFNLHVTSNVNIEVYNVLGRKVASLMNGVSVAGKHEIRLDGNDLASGTYFVHMQVEHQDGSKRFTELRKLTVTK